MRPDVLSSDDGGRGFHTPKLLFFLLAALELENRPPLPTPLDATAIAAGTVIRWNVRGWFNLESFRSRGIVVRAAFRGLRCAFRYGPVLASSHPRYCRPWQPLGSVHGPGLS